MNFGVDIIVSAVRNAIEAELIKGNDKFIIFPYGEMGMKTKEILNKSYGIEEVMIIDNHLAAFNRNIKSLKDISKSEYAECRVLLSLLNEKMLKEIKVELREVFDDKQIIDIHLNNRKIMSEAENFGTKVGKMCSGPLCNNRFVEKVGSFCQFGPGVDVVPNHQINYISCHNFLTDDKTLKEFYGEDYRIKQDNLFIEGVVGSAEVQKVKRITIGNDVWLGENVLITNGSNIGNGVIAGAGAVITKDVPDYAVVAGVPARIIKFRYNKPEIEALNRIKWWDWSNEEIKERYEDFYLSIEEFCLKYDREYKNNSSKELNMKINMHIEGIEFEQQKIQF